MAPSLNRRQMLAIAAATAAGSSWAQDAWP
ncbi:MAG: hypothetical protein RL227_436, partial [Pseudomonadota bacterium]